MRRRTAAVVICTMILLLGAGARTADRGWTPDLMFKVKRVGPVVPSPDGTLVAFVVSEPLMDGEKSEFNSQIHVGTADGSASFQLTRGEKSATGPKCGCTRAGCTA